VKVDLVIKAVIWDLKDPGLIPNLVINLLYKFGRSLSLGLSFLIVKWGQVELSPLSATQWALQSMVMHITFMWNM